MRRLVVLIVLFLVILSAAAQDELPLSDYLIAVNSAFDHVENTYSFDGAILRLLVEKELVQRYSSTPDMSAVPLSVLIEANSHVQGMYFSLNAFHWWEGLVGVWLDSAPAPQDLASGYHEDIDSTVGFFDFEADDIPEMLVRDSGTIEGYIGARWDGARWQTFAVPLPKDIPASHSYAIATNLWEIGFDDTNGDGRPEWRVIAANGGGCQGCFVEVGELHILGWRAGTLAQLVPPVYYDTGTDGVTWAFDRDGFTKQQNADDSWGCKWYGEERYRWDDDSGLYAFESESLDYEKSFECALRVAEKANWAGELEAAAALYELALARVTGDVTATNQEARQYAILRLAIVYTLTGQHDNAALLIDALAEETPQSQFIADVLAAIGSNVPDPYRTCTAVHNLFTRDYAAFSSRVNGSIPTEMTIGYVLDDMHPVPMYRPLPTPDKAGCDVEMLLATVFTDGLFFGLQTPRTVLEAHGIGVMEERLADLDGDGTAEWIVWLTADVPALVIHPQRYNASGLPLVERLNLPRAEADAPFVMPTPSPTPDSTVSHGPDPDRFPCHENASCDMFDPKTVYVLIEHVTGLTYGYGGGNELPPSAPRLRRALDAAIEQDSPAEYPLRYLQGLSLEADDNIEAARAEFAAIIDAAPDSPWAVLAALHVR